MLSKRFISLVALVVLALPWSWVQAGGRGGYYGGHHHGWYGPGFYGPVIGVGIYLGPSPVVVAPAPVVVAPAPVVVVPPPVLVTPSPALAPAQQPPAPLPAVPSREVLPVPQSMPQGR
jgi:hypothetical protein